GGAGRSAIGSADLDRAWWPPSRSFQTSGLWNQFCNAQRGVRTDRKGDHGTRLGRSSLLDCVSCCGQCRRSPFGKLMVSADPDMTGLRVLVVEGALLVADLIGDALGDGGCDVVGPVSRLMQGLALATVEQLDGALLDVNLAGERCFPIAAALRTRGI